MKRNEIEKTVMECIQRVCHEQSIPLKTVEFHHRVVEDLGLRSLDVATLTAFLESSFKFDPFSQNLASITDIRTVKDICDLYEKGLKGTLKPAATDDANDADSARIKRKLARRSA